MASFFILKCDLGWEAKRVPMKYSCWLDSLLVVQCQFQRAVPASSQQGESPDGGNCHLQLWGQQPYLQCLFCVLFALEDTLCMPPPRTHPIPTEQFHVRALVFWATSICCCSKTSAEAQSVVHRLAAVESLGSLLEMEDLGLRPRPTETESAF